MSHVARMISRSERIFYSINVDCDMSRVSGFDDHHQEHWIVIEHGKGYRERRNEALTRILESIEAGDPAGKVPQETEDENDSQLGNTL